MERMGSRGRRQYGPANVMSVRRALGLVAWLALCVIGPWAGASSSDVAQTSGSATRERQNAPSEADRRSCRVDYDALRASCPQALLFETLSAEDREGTGSWIESLRSASAACHAAATELCTRGQDCGTSDEPRQCRLGSSRDWQRREWASHLGQCLADSRDQPQQVRDRLVHHCVVRTVIRNIDGRPNAFIAAGIEHAAAASAELVRHAFGANCRGPSACLAWLDRNRERHGLPSAAARAEAQLQHQATQSAAISAAAHTDTLRDSGETLADALQQIATATRDAGLLESAAALDASDILAGATREVAAATRDVATATRDVAVATREALLSSNPHKWVHHRTSHEEPSAPVPSETTRPAPAAQASEVARQESEAPTDHTADEPASPAAERQPETPSSPSASGSGASEPQRQVNLTEATMQTGEALRMLGDAVGDGLGEVAAAVRGQADHRDQDPDAVKRQIDAWDELEKIYPHAEEIAYGILLVPDPRIPRHRRAYDLSLAGIDMGMLEAGFVLDRYAMPWQSYLDDVGNRGATDVRSYHSDPDDGEVGILVYRKDDWRQPGRDETRLRVLYVVAESGTYGVQRNAFVNALLLTAYNTRERQANGRTPNTPSHRMLSHPRIPSPPSAQCENQDEREKQDPCPEQPELTRSSNSDARESLPPAANHSTDPDPSTKQASDSPATGGEPGDAAPARSHTGDDSRASDTTDEAPSQSIDSQDQATGAAQPEAAPEPAATENGSAVDRRGIHASVAATPVDHQNEGKAAYIDDPVTNEPTDANTQSRTLAGNENSSDTTLTDHNVAQETATGEKGSNDACANRPEALIIGPNFSGSMDSIRAAFIATRFNQPTVRPLTQRQVRRIEQCLIDGTRREAAIELQQGNADPARQLRSEEAALRDFFRAKPDWWRDPSSDRQSGAHSSVNGLLNRYSECKLVDEIQPPGLHVVTPSASSESNTRLPVTECITVSVATIRDTTKRRELTTFLENRGLNRNSSGVVILHENSVFGWNWCPPSSRADDSMRCAGNAGQDGGGNSGPYDLCHGATKVSFPANISDIRFGSRAASQERREQALRGLGLPVDRSGLFLADGVENGSEFPDSQRSLLSTASASAKLDAVLRGIREVDPRVVVVVATDVRDRLFLIDRLRRVVPAALLVDPEVDILLAHPDYLHATRGVITIGPRGLLPANGSGTNHKDRGRIVAFATTGQWALAGIADRLQSSGRTCLGISPFQEMADLFIPARHGLSVTPKASDSTGQNTTVSEWSAGEAINNWCRRFVSSRGRTVCSDIAMNFRAIEVWAWQITLGSVREQFGPFAAPSGLAATLLILGLLAWGRAVLVIGELVMHRPGKSKGAKRTAVLANQHPVSWRSWWIWSPVGVVMFVVFGWGLPLLPQLWPLICMKCPWGEMLIAAILPWAGLFSLEFLAFTAVILGTFLTLLALLYSTRMLIALRLLEGRARHLMSTAYGVAEPPPWEETPLGREGTDGKFERLTPDYAPTPFAVSWASFRDVAEISHDSSEESLSDPTEAIEYGYRNTLGQRSALAYLLAWHCAMIRQVNVLAFLNVAVLVIIALIWPLPYRDVYLLTSFTALLASTLVLFYAIVATEGMPVTNRLLCNRPPRLKISIPLLAGLLGPVVALIVFYLVLDLPGVLEWGSGPFGRLLSWIF